MQALGFDQSSFDKYYYEEAFERDREVVVACLEMGLTQDDVITQMRAGSLTAENVRSRLIAQEKLQKVCMTLYG